MLTRDFDYDLPQELIAQEPIVPKDTSRLYRAPSPGPRGRPLSTALLWPHVLEMGGIGPPGTTRRRGDANETARLMLRGERLICKIWAAYWSSSTAFLLLSLLLIILLNIAFRLLRK